jgi:hypothetical protein
MRYVLVNHRTPKEACTCFTCGNAIEDTYVREIGNRLFYCDQLCLAGAIKSSELAIERIARKAAL